MNVFPRHRTAPENGSRWAHLWHRLGRTLRFHHVSVVHRSRDPHGAAQSFALGVFLGFMPISVFATVLALVLPRRFGWRTIPAVVGTFASNWLTAPFILGASVFVGRLVTHGEWSGFHELIPRAHGMRESFRAYAHLGASFFVGITLVSLAAAAVAYLVVHLLIRAALRLRQERVLARLRSAVHLPHRSHSAPAATPPDPPPPPPPSAE